MHVTNELKLIEDKGNKFSWEIIIWIATYTIDETLMIFNQMIKSWLLGMKGSEMNDENFI